MGREHFRAFRLMEGVEVPGIVSRTRSSAEALASEFGVLGVFDSIEELYAKTQASIVVVAVSEPAMKDVSIACLEFPWNLFIEKPPGLTVAEVEELLEAAKERKCNVKIAFNRQNYSVTQCVMSELSKRDARRVITVLDQESRAAACANGYPEQVVKN